MRTFQMMIEKYNAEEMMEAFSQGRYRHVLEHALPAAGAGNADAQCMIGLLYQLGTGVPQDGNEAVRWYRKAAAQDQPIAWCNLGTIYDSALLGAPDEGEARKCYLRAYQLGGPTNVKYLPTDLTDPGTPEAETR